MWINTENKLASTEKYIILLGMVNTMKILLTYIRCLNDFRLIPEKLKEDMKLNIPESLNKTLINVLLNKKVQKELKNSDILMFQFAKRNNF